MRFTRIIGIVGTLVVLQCGYVIYQKNSPSRLKEPFGSDVLLSHPPGQIASAPSGSNLPAGTDVLPAGTDVLPAGTDVLMSQLPGLQGWRTFAKPLALENGGLLLFQRDGGNAVVWRID